VSEASFVPWQLKFRELACRAASPRKNLGIILGHDFRQLRFGGEKSMINMMLFNPENHENHGYMRPRSGKSCQFIGKFTTIP
jgi:hypothetical protein